MKSIQQNKNEREKVYCNHPQNIPFYVDSRHANRLNTGVLKIFGLIKHVVIMNSMCGISIILRK